MTKREINQKFDEIVDFAGIELTWEGAGVEEKGYRKDSGEIIVEVDLCYFRPTEEETLLGDATKARAQLNWKPHYTLDEMIEEMVASDLEKAKTD